MALRRAEHVGWFRPPSGHPVGPTAAATQWRSRWPPLITALLRGSGRRDAVIGGFSEGRVQLDPEPVAPVALGRDRRSARADEWVEDKTGLPGGAAIAARLQFAAHGEVPELPQRRPLPGPV